MLLITLVVTATGVIIAVQTLKKSNHNASAATVATLIANFRDTWHAFVSGKAPAEQEFALHELFNALELACGVESQGCLVGNSGKLARQFIWDNIQVLARNDAVACSFREAIQNPDDFEFTRAFQDRHPSRPVL